MVLIYNAMTQIAPENTADQVTRLPDGRWAPGRSPNHGGRPKIFADIRDLARQHTRAALETLVEICRYGKNESARVAAANSLLDRGWGRPPVSLELREPEPQHIIELIEDAEHLTQELFAVPLAITDADGTSNKDALNIRDSPVTLGRKGRAK